MNKKVTWSDLQNGTYKDLQKTYKMTTRDLENGVRRHLDGATAEERRKVYQKVWTPEEKR